jgi:mRNA interferase MazF
MQNSERVKLIRDWCQVQIDIAASSGEKKYFQERDVWWASIGINIGDEENGKHQKFERPVLILKKFNQHLILIVPLSSKLKNNNKYYHKIIISGQSGSVIVSQIRAISSKRLIRKMGQIDIKNFSALRQLIRSLI